ncbi:SAM-dependent methyltransferase [Pyxidicoccus parkwayensis]|uniref:S-adenosyl-L-methionine-dependent methyltransferase n=1 Tax=Pyxidicoccus parkwayensis TaxID=2813578 RepID=A0ABX7P5I9_9BACT|nr:SAM-dependent methyltransferase [Pyxidicoccus parkwaysis]QSQ25764.1 SAM-dependent methyltransferase [Pyxidicoccus parkwaysis]
MKEGKPSQTASMVAYFRAVAHLGVTSAKGFQDPTAEHLLPTPWAQLFRLTQRRARKAPQSLANARRGTDLLALRTLTIDAHVRDALAQGARQLVILGAGLDGRAYRLRELSDVRVFEVDHPATQAWKQRRASVLPVMAKSLAFVPVDFERDSLDAALTRAGHDSSAPTVWIWEGVVMYLTTEALRTTLRVLTARSAPGSTAIIQYNTHRSMPGPLSLLLRIWREPQISMHTPEVMAAELGAVGFHVIADSGIDDWARRFDATSPGHMRQGSRVVAARK